MSFLLVLSLLPLLTTTAALSTPFPFETIQLSPTSPQVLSFPSIQFASFFSASPPTKNEKCRAFPGTSSWPSEEDWNQFNTSLNGALLRPLPAAAACYPGPEYNSTLCSFMTSGQAGKTHFWVDNPVESLTRWPAGWGCLLRDDNATGVCERGGWPEYVVNVSSVKHVQATVNFARNKGVRLVIKNTGHDFGGRSMGAGSLSVWTHNLKSFQYIPEYTVKSGKNEYSGPAVKVAAGVETYKLFNHMAENNITVVAPGGGTVGPAGGWFSVAGHGALTSKYGLGADQVLEISLVTAGGQFITVGPNSTGSDADLWWALRGGGGSTFGIITSVMFKAHPPISTLSTSLNFGLTNLSITNNTYPFPIIIPPGTGFSSPPSTNFITSPQNFWTAVSYSYQYCNNNIIPLGGYCFSYIYPLNSSSSSFAYTVSHNIPNITSSSYRSLLLPLYTSLQSILDISIPLPEIPVNPTLYAGNGLRTASTNPSNTRYRSRLFPLQNFHNQTLYNQTFSSIRSSVEKGNLTFHGISYSPSLKIAGWPGSNSAVLPAWRETVLHGILMEVIPSGITADEGRKIDAHAQEYIERWKELTPGAGSYMNEGDPMEKNWQWEFFGSNYRRLLGIKRRIDPWGVFWARTTVGTEEWEVLDEKGFPGGQNGRLCRV